jgi:uncharacterized protein involved in exopolysaccharide biosynthesis
MENLSDIDDEINLLDYFNVLKKRKKLIIIIVAISVLTTGIVSFLQTKIYEAKAVIEPVTQQSTPSGMGALAAQFGISAPPPTNAAETVNLLKSRILMEKIIKNHDLLPILVGKNIKDNTENGKIWMGIRALMGITTVNYKQKDNVIELSVQFKDPKIATDIVNYYLTELTDHMSSEAKRVALTNKRYLESELNATADPFIKTKIYSLIAQQIETAMLAEAKENFAFKILDPSRVPDTKIKPKRKQMVMISFVVSLFLGIMIAFFKEYVEKTKAQSQEEAK